MVVEEPDSKSDALNEELGTEVGIKKKVFIFFERIKHDVYQNPLSTCIYILTFMSEKLTTIKAFNDFEIYEI